MTVLFGLSIKDQFPVLPIIDALRRAVQLVRYKVQRTSTAILD